MPASHAPASDDLHGPDCKALRLLYVEDNRLSAILFEEALRQCPGLEVRLAVDSDDALEQLRDWLPDVLVLDAHLPGMSGFELLALLRQQQRLSQLPAFMCSADSMPAELARARDAGFTGFWPKPIDVKLILGDLHRLTGQRGES